MITETDLLETERLAKACQAVDSELIEDADNFEALPPDAERFMQHMNPQRTLGMVEEIRQLQKSVEFHREQFRAKALRNGENCLERDSLRANEEIKRLTKVNESHCRLWNEAEDDLKRTRGLLEEALTAADQMRTGLKWASMQFLSEQFVAEMHRDGKHQCWRTLGSHIDNCLKTWDEAVARIRASRGES